MDRAPGLAVCGLGDIGQVVFDLLAHRLGALLAADPRVDAAHVPDRAQVALDEEARGGIGIAAVSVFEDLALAGDKGVEVVRRDELVLGAVDEPHQVAVEPLTGVIDQGQARPDVPDEQELTDAVQHIGPRRQPHLRARFGQHPMAEAVEVGHRHAGRGGGAHRLLDPLAQLARGLDVVGQDQDRLRCQVRLGREQPGDALDDDPRLARARPGDDHRRPIAELDDGALLRGERGGRGHDGDGGSLPIPLIFAWRVQWTRPPPEGKRYMHYFSSVEAYVREAPPGARPSP